MGEINLINIPWCDILYIKVLPRLSIIDLYNLRSVSQSCKELVESYLPLHENIDLSASKKFQKRDFRILLKQCKNVKYLNASNCNWLNDRILINFLNKNDNVVYVDLSYCNSLSVKALQPIINKCKNLKSLRLSGCKWLTNSAVDAIVYNHINLEDINFDKCINITEPCLLKLLIKCKNIRNLSLVGVRAVSDLSLIVIASHSMELKTLNINECFVTPREIRKVIANCNKLEGLKIAGTTLTKYDFEDYPFRLLDNLRMAIKADLNFFRQL